jgi:hypothetical protein
MGVQSHSGLGRGQEVITAALKNCATKSLLQQLM